MPQRITYWRSFNVQRIHAKSHSVFTARQASSIYPAYGSNMRYDYYFKLFRR